jgi:hypothetical protein
MCMLYECILMTLWSRNGNGIGEIWISHLLAITITLDSNSQMSEGYLFLYEKWNGEKRLFAECERNPFDGLKTIMIEL